MKKIGLIVSASIIIATIVVVTIYAQSQGIALLDPQGAVAAHQRDLLVFASWLSLFALIPTFALVLFVVMRYRQRPEGTKVSRSGKGSISPESSIAWLALLLTITTVLAAVMLKSTWQLDPYRPLKSDKEPLTVQVVALQWKWLFIYPDQGIATVNELIIPEDRPVSFEITADAPMSSFWIPKLGGMIYAMEGMVTKLNLVANETGQFEGRTAEINGKGYAGMKFTTKAVSQTDFDQWVSVTQGRGGLLNSDTYQALAVPSTNNPTQHFAHTDPALYGSILMKFMDSNHHQDSPHSSSSH